MMFKRIVSICIIFFILVGCSGVNDKNNNTNSIPISSSETVDEDTSSEDKLIASKLITLDTGSSCEFYIYEDHSTHELYGMYNAMINIDDVRKGYQEYMAFASAGEQILKKFYYLVEINSSDLDCYDVYSYEDGEYTLLYAGIDEFVGLNNFSQEESDACIRIYLAVLDEILKDDIFSSILSLNKIS